MSGIEPYTAMQAAVDIITTSAHETSKVAASLFKGGLCVSRTNYWPNSILSAFGKDTDIGNSSGTVHAETACILQAGVATGGASLCVTDPFCPNCAKNIAEAGIRRIYIDHKGFDKDFFKRRSGHFETMSMRICEKAGIAVYELWRKDRRLVPIFEPRDGYVPPDDSPVYHEPIESAQEAVFTDIISQGFKRHAERKFACVIAQNADGALASLTARGHAVTGFTTGNADDLTLMENSGEKYSFFQQPVNRLLMHMARHGMKPVDGYFFSAQVPTSRELVNLVGAGLTRVTVGDIRKSRDADALVAMKQLSDAGVVDFT